MSFKQVRSKVNDARLNFNKQKAQGTQETKGARTFGKDAGSLKASLPKPPVKK